MDDHEQTPTAADAVAVAKEFCGVNPHSVRRFPRGLAHWVYDVCLPGSASIVVRLTTPQQQDDFLGAVHWSRTLRPLDVPLPALLAYGEVRGLPYLVLERLAGDDLGAVYNELTANERRAIAEELCRVQRLVATLPEATGYGAVKLPVGPYLPSWRAVVDDALDCSRRRIEAAGLIRSGAVQRVQNRTASFERYLERVRPIPFLDDTTTKNVLVHGGRMSGIVDVDEICFGDPLFTIGQTRAQLLNLGFDTDYTGYWCDALELTPEQRGGVALYTALSCVVFMSEFGQQFNRGVIQADEQQIARLENALDEQLAQT